MNRQSSVVCYLTSVSFFGFLSSAVCPLSSVFMQNKPNSPIVQMNASLFITMNYTFFISLTEVKNKPNSNPISKNFDTLDNSLFSCYNKCSEVFLWLT